MSHFTVSIVTGLVAGVIDIIPMVAKRLSASSCASAFLCYFFAAVIIFHSDLPYLSWWADGVGVTLMMAIPTLLIITGKDKKAIPIILLNAVLLGFLISVAERYI